MRRALILALLFVSFSFFTSWLVWGRGEESFICQGQTCTGNTKCSVDSGPDACVNNRYDVIWCDMSNNCEPASCDYDTCGTDCSLNLPGLGTLTVPPDDGDGSGCAAASAPQCAASCPAGQACSRVA